MKKQMTNRKWKIFLLRLFAVDLLIIWTGILAYFTTPRSDVVLYIGAGLGDLVANFATYFAANVAQKRVISENYRTELAEER